MIYNIIRVVVVGGGVYGDNRGTSSFGHSALLGPHEENFMFGQKFWVWAKILGLAKILGWSENFRSGPKF